MKRRKLMLYVIHLMLLNDQKKGNCRTIQAYINTCFQEKKRQEKA